MKLPVSILRKSIPLVLALGAGYVGSELHSRLHQGKSYSTIRSTRFELLDESGKTVAFWTANPVLRNGGDAGAVLAFADPRGVRRFELGMSDGNSGPFLRLYGRDKAERVGVSLGYDSDPVLLLSDRYKVRAVLGSIHGDAPDAAEDQWGLSLRARKEGAGAWIGFTHWGSGLYQAGVSLRNGDGRRWDEVVGEDLKPLPLLKRRNQ